ncbi:DEKNAAC103864 [Brettanomyces naardenensis]|uniref:DEKNAAC103864 n=1 Tax=Brettanomyces naardenensis TaxID=13370 RepID=A0A448YPD3_BRENA|nr:DEKNAAC103864 [Brettanomyces naardenensis]
MAPSFRDEGHLIVYPGSQRTLIRFGLEDSITPPTYSIPTKVYKNPSDERLFKASPPDGVEDPERYAVYPIKKGEIVNVDALNFLFKSIVKSVIRDRPLILLDSISFTLVQSSQKWSPSAIETITNYVFEVLQLAAFAIVPSALCSMFAFGSFPNACVIDVGFEKAEISPIVDFQVYAPATVFVNEGGNSINEKLQRLLPNLTAAQIETLKKSPIFEHLSEEDAKASFFSVEDLLDDKKGKESEDEGVLDIAAIVTSDKPTREILAEKERQKKQKGKKHEELKSNSELETNSFIDDQGNSIEVGKERFQGCGELIDSISNAIYKALSKVPDVKRRQKCYDNLVICGHTTAIRGFKEELLVKLYSKFSVGTDLDKLGKSQQNQDQQGAAFRNESSSLIDEISLAQAPKRIKVVPKPEYFSTWKKVGLEDCAFLGGEIMCRQIFGGSGNSELYLSKEEYYDKGPMGIWHVKL